MRYEYLLPDMKDTPSPHALPATGEATGGSLSSSEWVEAIIASPAPVLRNLQITQSYHQFTLDFTRLLGSDNVCWCAFATWASKQAGQFIRGEQAPAPLLELLGLKQDGSPTPRPWYWFLVPKWLLRSKRFLAYARCTVEDVSAHIAAGNLRVYQKLAPIFAAFLKMAHSHQQPQPDELARFLDGLAADPTTHAEIIQAFQNYYLARFEKNDKARAEQVFLANVLIGLHEQKRLQEAIEGAMKAPIRQALQDPERRWSSLPLPQAVRAVGAALFEWALGPYIRKFEEKWQTAATHSLMSLGTPDGTLKLGQDVPPLSDGALFPEALRELDRPEVPEILATLGLPPNTAMGSAALDWSRLGDRMNYIAGLFRSRQQDKGLAEPPFSYEQVAYILAGQVPEGKL
ncbi:MAG: hypothetical protein H6564_06130 [Lewinellaceae bacterium]|nr:hypothetical protein [Lewinellaceae bacterium]